MLSYRLGFGGPTSLGDGARRRPGVRVLECVGCQTSDQDDRLSKCPICFKWVCERCALRSMGRLFCSRKCADQFFFGDDED
jgi:hypothetical protein